LRINEEKPVNTFDWIEIRTSDLEKTAAFYQTLFGWNVIAKETADGTGVWIIDTNSEPRIQNLRRGGIWARPKGEQQGFIVYIHVDNIEKTLRRVQELNGKVVSPIIETSGGSLALIIDPCGNPFGIYQDKPATV